MIDGPEDDANVMVLKSDDAKTKTLFKKGPYFLLILCFILIIFYIVACILAHCAYREWKGIVEDCARGSVNRVDSNIFYLAIIDKRENDAIEEQDELDKKRRERALQRAMMMGDQAMDDENNMMMMGEGGQIE